jgi:hypothetical protein
MKKIIRILVCKLLPFFSSRKLAIKQKRGPKDGDLYFATTVEPQFKVNGDCVSLGKRLRNLQKESRKKAFQNMIELSDHLTAEQLIEVKLLVTANRSDVLQPVRKKFAKYFINLSQSPHRINEAIYWESKILS